MNANDVRKLKVAINRHVKQQLRLELYRNGICSDHYDVVIADARKAERRLNNVIDELKERP